MNSSSSGMRWICATVAPWVLGAGLLVSFTAVASNNPNTGISAGPAYIHERPLLSGLVPDAGFATAASAVLPQLDFGVLAADSTRLVPGVAFAPRGLGNAIRTDMKIGAADFPTVDRSNKGEPAGVLRSSLSRRGLEIRRDRAAIAEHLAFARDRRALPPTVLMRGELQVPDWDASRSLEPWSGEDPTTTQNASSIQSPAAAAAGSTGAAHGATSGATPSTARALALSSTTPAPSDAVPLEVAAAPVSAPLVASTFDKGASPEARPHYAALIAPQDLGREQRCLAEAVYFEARSEPEDGQAAVAQVVLNRVKSGLYPSSVCGVVYQNRHRHLACQFTFACEGKSLRITDSESWDRAERIAEDVMNGRTYLADIGDATHYHADYVRPSWARKLKRMDVIGRHIFYELRPGQT